MGETAISVSSVLTDVATAVSDSVNIILANPILAVFVGFGITVAAMRVFKSGKRAAN